MSIAVSISAIDQALYSLFEGMEIRTGTPPVLTEVSVFIEDPNSEEYRERVFPSITIRLLSIIDDISVYNTEDDVEEEIGYDAEATPQEREMRAAPLPKALLYSIDTWNRGRAKESRDLLAEVFVNRVRPRGKLTVVNLQGVDQDLWMFAEGSVVSNPQRRPDEIIYHSTLTVRVLASLLVVSEDDTVIEKVAEVIQWSPYVSSYRPTADGKEIEIIDAENSLDMTFNVLDSGEEVLP